MSLLIVMKKVVIIKEKVKNQERFLLFCIKSFLNMDIAFIMKETNELENIAFQLQSQGFVEFSKKSILGDSILILNQEENCLDPIYKKELKRVPVKRK